VVVRARFQFGKPPIAIVAMGMFYPCKALRQFSHVSAIANPTNLTYSKQWPHEKSTVCGGVRAAYHSGKASKPIYSIREYKFNTKFGPFLPDWLTLKLLLAFRRIVIPGSNPIEPMTKVKVEVNWLIGVRRPSETRDRVFPFIF
jgi:hypothetical protein